MITIEILWSDFLMFLHHLLSPEILGTVLTVGGVMYKFIRSIEKKFSDDSEKLVKDVKVELKQFKEESNDNYKDLKVEVLRLQLLDGMDSHRLSASEAAHFYDKYHELGGNSFVTEKYYEYLRELEEEENAKSNSGYSNSSSGVDPSGSSNNGTDRPANA